MWTRTVQFEQQQIQRTVTFTTDAIETVKDGHVLVHGSFDMVQVVLVIDATRPFQCVVVLASDSTICWQADGTFAERTSTESDVWTCSVAMVEPIRQIHDAIEDHVCDLLDRIGKKRTYIRRNVDPYTVLIQHDPSDGSIVVLLMRSDQHLGKIVCEFLDDAVQV